MIAPISTPAAPEPRTSQEEIDDLVARLASRAPQWADLDIGGRLHYLRACLDEIRLVAREWVSTAARIKDVGDRASLVGEEWLAGPTAVARNIRLLIDALENDAQPPPVAMCVRGNGQHVATIFPATVRERLLFRGFKGEVWIEPGRPPSQGRFYGERTRRGCLTVVLGAGNVTSIPLMDALHKLFVEGSVVLLKMHPILAPLGVTFERAFRPLADAGFFAIAYGGSETGAALVDHPSVDAIHLTGSAETHDGIVWGPDPLARTARKRSGTPVNRRTITSELGCVTPVIVTPGRWSTGELAFQARHVASMIAHNAGYNCTAAQVVVTSGTWPQRRDFLDQLRAALSDVPPRTAFYPGARRRHESLLARYPTAWTAARSSEAAVPWTFVERCDPNGDAFAFEHELFCGAAVEVPLDAGPDRFLDSAVAFVNERCWGTLSAVVLIDDATRARQAEALDRAIASLRYGVVGINLWSGVAFGLASPPWGSVPGNTPTDIQSGTGFVHNTYLFDHPQKTVMRAPFVIAPTPAWFADHPRLLDLGVSVFEHEAHPTVGRLARVVWAAVR